MHGRNRSHASGDASPHARPAITESVVPDAGVSSPYVRGLIKAIRRLRLDHNKARTTRAVVLPERAGDACGKPAHAALQKDM